MEDRVYVLIELFESDDMSLYKHIVDIYKNKEDAEKAAKAKYDEKRADLDICSRKDWEAYYSWFNSGIKKLERDERVSPKTGGWVNKYIPANMKLRVREAYTYLVNDWKEKGSPSFDKWYNPLKWKDFDKSTPMYELFVLMTGVVDFTPEQLQMLYNHYEDEHEDYQMYNYKVEEWKVK